MENEKNHSELFPLWQKLLILFVPLVALVPFGLLIHNYFAAKKFELGGIALREEYYKWIRYECLFYAVVLIVALIIYRNQN